jgi:stage III sporulation protein AE
MFSTASTAVQEEEEELKELLVALSEEYCSYFLDENGNLTLPAMTVFLRLCSKVALGAFGQGLKNLKAPLFLIMLSGIFALFEQTVKGERGKGILRLCILLSGTLSLWQTVSMLFDMAAEHLGTLCGFISGLFPILNGLQLSMGAVNSASVTLLSLTLLLSLVGEFSCGLLLPFQKICFALDLTATITENKGLVSFASNIKRLFLFLLGGLSAFLLACFSFQSLVASKADSALLRAFRFTAGGLVPMVGSALSESSKTVLAGLDLLKSTIGGIGISVVLLMLLPPLCTLFAYSFCFTVAGSLAKATENELLTSLFSFTVSVLNGLCAIIILCDLSVLFILTITLTQSVI